MEDNYQKVRSSCEGPKTGQGDLEKLIFAKRSDRLQNSIYPSRHCVVMRSYWALLDTTVDLSVRIGFIKHTGVLSLPYLGLSVSALVIHNQTLHRYLLM